MSRNRDGELHPVRAVRAGNHRDNQRGHALARRIEGGVVDVNDQAVADEPQLPPGRVEDGGRGRSGPQSMADVTELQQITARDGTGAYPI